MEEGADPFASSSSVPGVEVSKVRFSVAVAAPLRSRMDPYAVSRGRVDEPIAAALSSLQPNRFSRTRSVAAASPLSFAASATSIVAICPCRD
jgi:hypothetical protein